MQLKVFTADELHEALAQVRQSLGPEALILDRQIEEHGDGGKHWKVYAAVDQPLEPTPPDFTVAMTRLERLVDGLAKRETDGLRSTLTGVAKDAFDVLCALGMAPIYAQELAEDFSEGRMLATNSLRWAQRLDPQHRREVVILTGPSGVGKTLLAAKLATHFSLKGAAVAMLSLDTERIAADAQLAAYAEILGAPFYRARNRREVATALAETASARLLLVDSEGWSCQRPQAMKRLAENLAAIPATRRFLVIPANIDEEDGMQAIQEAARLAPTDLVFTKIDETKRPGKLVNLAAGARLPLSYCSFGPEVPEHMGWLSAKSMMSLLASRQQDGWEVSHGKAA